MPNHHLKSLSTSFKKIVAQFFWTQNQFHCISNSMTTSKKHLLNSVSTSAKNMHTENLGTNTHFELRIKYKPNTSTVVKDSVTHAYSIRLWVDHKIETWQPNDSTLVFYTERDANMSSLIVGSDDMIVSCELIKIKP